MNQNQNQVNFFNMQQEWLKDNKITIKKKYIESEAKDSNKKISSCSTTCNCVEYLMCPSNW